MMAKKTLIIGGASGIGFAVARALAERGESLILAGRDSEKLARARQFLSQKKAAVNTVVLDISKEEEVIQLSQTLGEVDNIIVTAGSHALAARSLH
jgi:short-subunit dehydrogenase